MARDNLTVAFTLIELLVTVAIISVLAGLLLPSLSRAKGKAQGVKCVSNGRQLGIGLMLYVGDHEETYPPSADYSAATDDPGRIWNTKLLGYTRARRFTNARRCGISIIHRTGAARGQGRSGNDVPRDHEWLFVIIE